MNRFVLFRGLVLNIASIMVATYEPGPGGPGITKIFLVKDVSLTVPGDVREELLAALNGGPEASS